MGLVLLLTRGLAMLKDVTVSRSFGTSDDLEAFLIAFGMMTFVGSAISNAGMSTLVPALSRARNDRDPDSEGRTTVVAAVAAVAFSSIAAGAVILFRARLTHWVAPGFDAHRAASVQHLLVALAAVPALGTTQSLVSGALNSRYGFRGAAALTAITPACVAGMVLVRTQPSALDLVSGTLLGMTLELAGLVALANRHGITLFARVEFASGVRTLKTLTREFAPLLAGTALSSTSPLVDQAFASVVGAGAVASLNYGNRLTSVAMGIGISSVGLIALPHFSELAARNAWDEMRPLLRRLVGVLFLAGVLAAAFLALFSEPLIKLLFQRGHFIAADTSAVASVQSLYALQIPFHLAGIVGVRALQSMRRNRTIMLIVVLNVICNVVADYSFVKLYGLRGIALATSVTYIVACGAILTAAAAAIRRRIPTLSSETHS
ncbi:MAG: lipid II flippase MurJ [Polyangiaceae bacterium]